MIYMEIKVIEGIPEQGLGEGFKITTLIVEFSSLALCIPGQKCGQLMWKFPHFEKMIDFEAFPQK